MRISICGWEYGESDVVGEDEGDAEGEVTDEGKDDTGGEGLAWLYAASIPPTATMTAATSVRIPGKEVQNDFLLLSPIASFTISYFDDMPCQNAVFYLLSKCETAVDYSYYYCFLVLFLFILIWIYKTTLEKGSVSHETI